MFNRSFVRCFNTTARALESSCKEGTKINLSIYKAGKPIVALKDEEYPEWLWTLLDKDAQLEELKATDYFRYKRKILKKENVAHCKHNNFMSKMK
ncbi:unnamed protein product [[Candida] boidinii]|uniref:Large ribosomal subunit protein mL54 n=1 Tax=Candida boidinii TaxID=5477 RepID=A0A9W6W8T6_CANBO|nr:hypothetical protein BVG19_g808 [[Candida] boidinii]OWB50820.1 hypothetical protein B5S27_g2373 [[Candida] boidinii]OWB66160.1 hypothetical protein B5S30_g1496 [[Candida] boidinii]OWB84524.1 hypothetical protein B5S33_g3172 [[Candida] boidinii]GME68731.1 unnamed protein product [[Candida] boidinii]